jgi:hypothetical protein
MKFSKTFSVSVCIFMSTILSNVPAIAMVESANAMISTNAVVTELTREQNQAKINNFLSRSDVRNELMKRGLSSEEVTQRLASLNEKEMRQLSAQMDQAQYGGDILFAILIVVLIIFLIKRL